MATEKSGTLTILAYSDEECGTQVSKISVQVNPETVSRKHPLSFSQETDSYPKKAKPDAQLGIDKSGNPTLGLQTVSFDLMVDGTGLIKNASGCNNVNDFIEKFKETCYYYKGKTHGINYLKLIWGDVFNEQIVLLKFRLSNLDIQYLLFDAEGQAIRAKLTCSFTQFLSSKDIKALTNNSSPDLTHMMVIKDGDTLPLMSEDVYKDPKYYMQIAKINNLSSIHELNRGQRLIFPPFEQ